MKILAFESSCDDTAVALVEDGRRVLAHAVASQLKEHEPYGGVIPELAARAHVGAVNRLVEEVLQQASLTLNKVDAFAATLGPGLIGSLLVGVSTAKAFALATGKPFLGVQHLFAHVASNYLLPPTLNAGEETSLLEPPFLCLLVSGGHTQLIGVDGFDKMTLLGETLDDAVGEAYDKVARLMQLPYPGGPYLDALARAAQEQGLQVEKERFPLPTARTERPFDFSFSGLKTAFSRLYAKEREALGAAPSPETEEQLKLLLAGAFQQTIVATLLNKTLACAKHYGYTTLALAGGVSANSGLRAAWQQLPQQGFKVFMPAMAYCMDNAAMVGASAFFNPMSQTLEAEVFSRAAKMAGA
jgi:N6-L-threonylcarbamoyladenine synthase